MPTPGLPPMPTLRVVDPRRARRQRGLLLAGWLASVAVAYAVGRYVMIPDAGGLSAQLAEARSQLDSSRQQLAETEQRLANVERSEQVARLANENVQGALAEKDQRIAGLSRDLALYNRLLGPEAVRQPLNVHDVELRPAADGSIAFSVVLTQNQDTRRSNAGRLTVSVEGQQDGRLQRLAWGDLVGAEEADGLAYEFRYFQRLDGRLLLPAGFSPHTLRVSLRGSGATPVERELRWEAALVTDPP